MFAEAVGAGLEGLGKVVERRQLSQKLDEENEAIKNAYGVDLRGIHDKKERMAILQSELDAQQKEKHLEKKKKLTENILGGGQPEGGISVGGALRGEHGELQEPEISFSGNTGAKDQRSFADVPDREILELGLHDKDLANFVRQMKNVELKKRAEANEEVAGDQFARGYDAILSGDMDTLQDVLRDSKTPFKVKSRLTELKDRQEVRRSVGDREVRARQTMVQRAYQHKISNLNAQLKGYVQLGEKKDIKEQISKLEALQKADLQKLTKDPSSYPKLKIWKTDAAEFLEEEEVEEVNEDIDSILDNLSDDEIKQLISESGGDIELAKQLALERYAQ
jgi:hypothetical protein